VRHPELGGFEPRQALEAFTRSKRGNMGDLISQYADDLAFTVGREVDNPSLQPHVEALVKFVFLDEARMGGQGLPTCRPVVLAGMDEREAPPPGFPRVRALIDAVFGC